MRPRQPGAGGPISRPSRSIRAQRSGPGRFATVRRCATRKDRVTATDRDAHRWSALAVLCGGVLMIILDGTITTVALPAIQRDLGFTQAGLAWVVNHERIRGSQDGSDRKHHYPLWQLIETH